MSIHHAVKKWEVASANPRPDTDRDEGRKAYLEAKPKTASATVH